MGSQKLKFKGAIMHVTMFDFCWMDFQRCILLFSVLKGGQGGARVPRLVPRRRDELDGFRRAPTRVRRGWAGLGWLHGA